MLPLRHTLIALAALLLIAPAAHAASYQTTVAGDTPAGYWRLETIQSGFFGSDAPGSLQAGFQGATPASTAGAVGGAALLGGGTYLGIQATGTTVPAITLEGIFRLDALPAAATYAVLFDTTSGPGNAVLLAVDPAGSLVIASALDGVSGATGATILPGAFHHVALTREAGGDLTVHLDGTRVFISPASADPLVPGLFGGSVPSHTVGGQPGGGSPVVGAIDEVAVYGQALTVAQIAAHAGAIGGSDPPPPPNSAPVCPSPTVLVEQDTTLRLTAACTDADNDLLSYWAPPATAEGGTLAIAASNAVDYTPRAGFTGEDSFGYSASDSEATTPATVSLVVFPTGATAELADPGETVTTPSVDVTTPTGGAVVISQSSAPAPAGYELAGESFQIEAPDPAPGDRLRIVLRTTDPSAVVARDGVPITVACPSDDPCVESDTTSGGVRSIAILTPHASLWQLVRPGKAGKGCGDRNHAHRNEAGCKKRR